MPEIDLTAVPVAELDVVVNPCDLRHDLHIFASYVEERAAAKCEIKRSHRDNRLPKADALRLAKMMADPAAAAEIGESGESRWINFIDRLSLSLGFVKYETVGIYAGYSSVTESYPDNYIAFHQDRYERFLSKPLQAQEDALWNALAKDGECGDSEFFSPGPTSRLDRFSRYGCATGVMPLIKFAPIRLMLLKCLASCRSGVWYSTASFIAYLKVQHRYFLIPQDVPRGGPRYDNFTERHERNKGTPGASTHITDKSPDAFERVEGRFVERFLEGIPFALGYVDVAYAKPIERSENFTAPSINTLRAFRLTDRFLLALRNEIREPRVTVLPDFEVHIDSPFYPASLMSKFLGLGEFLAVGPRIVLKLNKAKASALMAAGSGPDALFLLRQATSRELPANIVTELKGWSDHAEIFTLYDGFGLLESRLSLAPGDSMVAAQISSTIAVISEPDACYERLEKAAEVPIKLRHSDSSLRDLSRGTQSLFSRERQNRDAKN